MHQEKVNFGIILRVFVSLLPLLLGAPSLAIIMCAYNISMSFIVFGPITYFISALSSICISMLFSSLYGAIGEISGLTLAMQAILSSLGCIYGYLLKRKFSLGLCLCTVGMLIPQYVYIQHLAALDGLSVAQAMVPTSEDIAQILSQTFSGAQTIISSVEINKIAVVTNEFITMLIPSAFVLSSVTLAYVVMWSVSVQLRKLRIGIHHSFSTIKIPWTMTIVLIALVFALFTINAKTNEIIIAVILNMVIILTAVCLFAGISFADFYLRKFIKFTLPRGILHAILILFVPIVPIVYIIAACVDSFVNFRKIMPLSSVKKGEPDEAEK